jgi:hypothetical protein
LALTRRNANSVSCRGPPTASRPSLAHASIGPKIRKLLTRTPATRYQSGHATRTPTAPHAAPGPSAATAPLPQVTDPLPPSLIMPRIDPTTNRNPMHTLLHAHLAQTLAAERTHTGLRRREQSQRTNPAESTAGRPAGVSAKAIDLMQSRLHAEEGAPVSALLASRSGRLDVGDDIRAT